MPNLLGNAIKFTGSGGVMLTCEGMADDDLIQVANAINLDIRRPEDVLARYGGEEFAVILPNTSAKGALSVAEEISAQIHQLRIPHSQSQVNDYLTLSMGITTIIPTL